MSKRMVRLFPDQLESGPLIDVPGCVEDAVGPEFQAPITNGARPFDAGSDEHLADTQAPGIRLHIKQAQFADLALLARHEEDRADHAVARLRDPGSLTRLIKTLTEVRKDPRYEHFVALIPAIFVGIDDGLPRRDQT